MKKTILFLFVIIMTINVSGQRRRTPVNWLSIAVKGGFGNSVLLNQDITNTSDVKQDFMAFSKMKGIRLGVTHGDYVGISVEGMMSSFDQSLVFSNSSAYTKTR